MNHLKVVSVLSTVAFVAVTFHAHTLKSGNDVLRLKVDALTMHLNAEKGNNAVHQYAAQRLLEENKKSQQRIQKLEKKLKHEEENNRKILGIGFKVPLDQVSPVEVKELEDVISTESNGSK